jgi:hypothetical protein
MERSVVIYNVAAYGKGKSAIRTNVLNVAVTRAIDLFLMVGDRQRLIDGSDRLVENQTGQKVRNVRAFLDHHMALDAFVRLVHDGCAGLVNDEVISDTPTNLGQRNQAKKRRVDS